MEVQHIAMKHDQFVSRPGVSIHYELSGDGPPVLLIQGVGVIGHGWRPQVDDLANGFQTVVFDNRGIGKSVPCTAPVSIEAMAEDARAIMDSIGWQSAHVVGHSMGGVIAQQLALDCPQRVRSLSLLCTFARAKDAARLSFRVIWMTLRTRVGSRRMRRRAFLEMLMPKDQLPPDVKSLASKFAQLIGRDLADSPPILFKQLRAMSRHNALSALPRLVGIPTLVVSAEYDRIALPRYGRALADAIRGAEFEQLGAASHGITLSDPWQINSRLRRFLTAVEAARH